MSRRIEILDVGFQPKEELWRFDAEGEAAKNASEIYWRDNNELDFRLAVRQNAS